MALMFAFGGDRGGCRGGRGGVGVAGIWWGLELGGTLGRTVGLLGDGKGWEFTFVVVSVEENGVTVGVAWGCGMIVVVSVVVVGRVVVGGGR